MKTGFRGTFVISWSQTEIDGLDAAPLQSLRVGSAWSWRGDAAQLDGPSGVLRLDRALGADTLRRRAASVVRRLVCSADHKLSTPDHAHSPATLEDRCFVITDGAQSYTVTAIDIGATASPLLMFVDELPPRGADLWVVRHTLDAKAVRGHQANTDAVICFTPGTRIATPRGQQMVEHLGVGDLVLTKDNGPQPVQWIGRRHMTGARLFATPAFRPVRIRAGALGVERPDQELLVSPQHRMLISSPAAQDLFNTPDVLVAAKDLIDGRKICVDLTVSEVTYIHLLLPGHNVLWANGVLTESFHPASASLQALSVEDRARLLAMQPELADDPHGYGGYARRNLTRSEAAILRHAA